jgi:acyl-coenzyme A thioesterase PaaI-like protein
VFKIKVEKGLQNSNGFLHGGVAAALIDEISTYALICKDKEARPGVLRCIH